MLLIMTERPITALGELFDDLFRIAERGGDESTDLLLDTFPEPQPSKNPLNSAPDDASSSWYQAKAEISPERLSGAEDNARGGRKSGRDSNRPPRHE